MKVLHYEHNGVGVVMSEALCRNGVVSTVLATGKHPFGFEEDDLLPCGDGYGARIGRLMTWARYAGYDVFHNHDLFVPRVAALRWRGAIVQHYHATFVTDPVPGVDAVLVSLPGLLTQFPEATWMPLPARTEMFRPDLRTHSDVVRVGYCAQRLDPNKPALIPEDEILEAVRLSAGRAVAVPLTGIHLQQDMPAYYAGLDVWVDRIGADFYGFSSVEAAAMGLPVVTQIGASEREHVPGCPFVSVDEGALRDAIAELIGDEDMRADLGARSRAFAEQFHSGDVVARRYIDVYSSLLSPSRT